MWKKLIVGYEHPDDDATKPKVPKIAWVNIKAITFFRLEVDVDYEEDVDGNEIQTKTERLRVRLGNENFHVYEMTEDELLKIVQNIPKNLPLIQGEKYVD